MKAGAFLLMAGLGLAMPGITMTSANAQTMAKALPASEGFSTTRLDRLDGYLQGVVDSGLAPNAAMLVARHGRIIYEKAFGWRNIEKKQRLKTDDLFRIASQTKAITTTALLMLWEEGKFLLDDPLEKYIPAFAHPVVLDKYDSLTHQLTTHPAKTSITIRELLSQSSGIAYDLPVDDLPEYKVPKINSLDTFTLAGIVPKIAHRPLLAEPGEKFVYGLNSDVAGYLVELFSGMRLDMFMRTRIFEPLGMKDTYFYLPENKKDRLVELYSKAAPDLPLTVATNVSNRTYPYSGAGTYLSGGAGLESTVGDYARFTQMILNKGVFGGHRLLSRKTVDMMMTNQIGENLVWDRGDKFGLGFEIVTPDTRHCMPATPGSLMWGGAYCSEYTIDPKEELLVLVFTNADKYYYYNELVIRCRTLVYQALE